MNSKILGREIEKQALDKYCSSAKPEFIAVYGRRRVGKTYLIKQYFDHQFTFYHTGLAKSNTKNQLANFAKSIDTYFKSTEKSKPRNWMEAFELLINKLKELNEERKIIFIDEIPWLDTRNSYFITALEFFWNSWASSRNDIKLIVCGSAASWIINKLFNDKGGLHNRITGKIKLNPFTLSETKQFLTTKGCDYNNYQYIQVYMTFGGIPYYLEQIDNTQSIPQNIDKLCFGASAFFRDEYKQLFKSLFSKHERHLAVVEALAKKSKGCTRAELTKDNTLKDGGSLNRILDELEASNFIRKYPSWQKKKRESIYQLIDFFTLFHLKFMANASIFDENFWINIINTPSYLSWSGYAFELVSLHHVAEIKKALGINGILTRTSAWYSKEAQIDLVIDRNDQVVNIIEIKFSTSAYLITKKYDEVLRNKIAIFSKENKEHKAIWLVMLSTYGLQQSPYNGLVNNSLTMDIFFS